MYSNRYLNNETVTEYITRTLTYYERTINLYRVSYDYSLIATLPVNNTDVFGSVFFILCYEYNTRHENYNLHGYLTFIFNKSEKKNKK
jgi:hypothetical protein